MERITLGQLLHCFNGDESIQICFDNWDDDDYDEVHVYSPLLNRCNDWHITEMRIVLSPCTKTPVVRVTIERGDCDG